MKEAQEGVGLPLDESTTIVVVPAVAQVTLKGRALDAGRTFLLPRALNALNEVWAFATRMQAKHAIVVGHVDATEAAAEELAKVRATLAAAWLQGDPKPWVDQYGDAVAEAERWGAREDRHMLSVALAGLAPPSAKEGETGDPLVRAFQTLAKVKVDGIAGPVTRAKLVERYFARSRVALLNGAQHPENGITLLETQVVSHSAGANVTLQQVADVKRSVDTAEPQTAPASDAQAKTIDDDTPPEPQARIDFMFFFSESKPEPAPGAADGPEFLEWVKQTEHQRTAVVGSAPGATQIWLESWDKAFSTRHRGAKYTLTGPETFTGTTDSQGRIEHDDVLPGDYKLELTLSFFEGADKTTDTYESSVIVVAGDRGPQVRGLGAVPRCELAQLKGLLFGTSKAFLVPEAVTALKEIRQVYERHNGSELLVVGHTDTTGDPSFNDPLSLERAKATLAYLRDDVDTWLSFYEPSVPESRRWSDEEDARMQELVNDPTLTRRELIAAYMALDGAELDAAEFKINATAHGCGENFPLDETGEELDTAPGNDEEDALDRRVELYFFDPEFGIAPKPAGENSKKGSTQYPAWRKLAKVVSEGEVDAPGSSIVHYVLLSNSGSVSLKQRGYELIADDWVRRGTTNDDGILFEAHLAPGTYMLRVGGVEVSVPSLPLGTDAIPHEVRGFFLAPAV